MLYLLISSVLFFTSAQSNDNINAYYMPFTGEFIESPQSIFMLARRLTEGFLNNDDYYQNIPKKLIELGFFSPENIADIQNNILNILLLADYCYNTEIDLPNISSFPKDNPTLYAKNLQDLTDTKRELMTKKSEFYKNLNTFYDVLKKYFLNNYSSLGLEDIQKMPELKNMLFMAYLIHKDLNLLTPHKLQPIKSGSKLKLSYVLLLLRLKDKERMTQSVLSAFNPFLSQSGQESLLNDLNRIFELRDQFLGYPLNDYGIVLDKFIKEHVLNLSNLLKQSSILTSDQVDNLLNRYSKKFFKLF